MTITAKDLSRHLPVDEWQDPKMVADELQTTEQEILQLVFTHHDFEYSGGMIRRVAY